MGSLVMVTGVVGTISIAGREALCRRVANEGARVEWSTWWNIRGWVAARSVLLLSGVSTTMRHISMPSVPLSKDFLLRLKPVIKGTLTDASFVVLVGAYGDLFVEIHRHGRG